MPPVNRNEPKRAASSESQYALMEFMRDFPDDATCLQWLWNTRYNIDGDRAFCVHCDQVRLFARYATTQRRQSWTCTACGVHVHPTAGTIFHKSSTSLHLWFYAMYLMTSTRCGISAKQLERELGVTYKTAWRMFTLIRNELMGPETTQLSGAVEMDETYVGGKPRAADRRAFREGPASVTSNAVRWAHEKKTGVFGMVEREGNVAAYVIPKDPASSIVAHIETHVDKTATVVHTDDSRLYLRLKKDGYNHRVINHSERVYVSGDVHTQTIDGFWSLVKRGISGTHHAVSPNWLQGYVNEYVWRYNHRDDGRSMFALLALRAAFPIDRG
jgi:transposase